MICHRTLTLRWSSRRQDGFGSGENRSMDGLPTWIRWIIVFGVGLSPILTVWAARAAGRYLRRKLWSRAPRGAADVADRSASPRENEAVDQRADGAF